MFHVSWWWLCASVARFHQIPLPVPRFFLQRYRSSLKTGPARPGHVKIARDITHQRQQHIVTFHHLDTIMLLPFVYWKRYLWSRLAPPTNLVNWNKRSDRLFERILSRISFKEINVRYFRYQNLKWHRFDVIFNFACIACMTVIHSDIFLLFNTDKTIT